MVDRQAPEQRDVTQHRAATHAVLHVIAAADILMLPQATIFKDLHSNKVHQQFTIQHNGVQTWVGSTVEVATEFQDNGHKEQVLVAKIVGAEYVLTIVLAPVKLAKAQHIIQAAAEYQPGAQMEVADAALQVLAA